MGSVDLAMRKEGSFQRLFAIKRLLPAMRTDPGVRAMFLEEARLAGLIRHPNVVSVIDVGEDEEGPFLVMDYVEGLSLANIASALSSSGSRMPLAVAMRLLSQGARGLHAAHELRSPDGTWLHLVHRDVSPHNILVGFDGIVRLTDFGIAKAAGSASRTSTGLLKGKSGYLSPEQLRFEEPDRRTDLFALGIVLFEALTGKRMFPGTSLRESARKVLNDEPPDLHAWCPLAPLELAQLVRQMLDRDLNQRPANAAVVADALEAIANSLPQQPGPDDVASFMREHFHPQATASAERIRKWMAAPEPPVTDVQTLKTSSEPALPELVEPSTKVEPNTRRRVRRDWAMALMSVIAIFGVLGTLAASAMWFSEYTNGRETSQMYESTFAEPNDSTVIVSAPDEESPPLDIEPQPQEPHRDTAEVPEVTRVAGEAAPERPRRAPARERRRQPDRMRRWSWQ